jgi:DeoR family transcriptional regulator, fructose operon transcriptional repressor
MLRVERQAKILQLIHERGFVQNEELAQVFEVTQATIRRDLKSLNQQNLIRLDHGGSYDIGLMESPGEPLYETKAYVNLERKRLIGKMAAEMVRDQETIILDSGTTNAQIAKSLRKTQLKDVTVVTPDLMVAKELCPEEQFHVVVLGGLLRRYYYSLYGPFTLAILKNIQANKVFLGIDAASLDTGISNLVLDEVPVKQLMIANSQQVIVVSDGSKFDRFAPYHVCMFDAVDHVISDDCLNVRYEEFFLSQGIGLDLVHAPREIACDD